MGSEAQQLHGFFFPLMAYGHMNPMVDIARLFAARGAKSTIITTLLSAPILTKTTERDRRSGLDINIHSFKFPGAEVGLPEGLENVDSITSPEMVVKFFMAVNLLQEPFRQLLEESRPDFIIADMFFPWSTDIASKLGIPRLVFHGMGFFSLCVQESIKAHEPYKKLPAGTESFVVPGLPDQIEVTISQVPDHVVNPGPFSDLWDRVRDSELSSFGVVVNSFYELEPAYADLYRNAMGRKAWHVGPVSLRNRDTADKAQRGREATVDEHFVLNWLDSKSPKSVLYICFGSLSRISSTPLKEIAMGLEDSGVSFVWVIRKSKKTDDQDDEENFLPEGFEERTKGKGLIIRDWAPQVLILDHQAIGGFMTHCGWNSILEGISAGVPMITWPMFAEQFYNEKFVTEVLKTGIKVGVEKWSAWIDTDEVVVKKEKVKETVTQLMGGGQEAEEMRRKAQHFKDLAKTAVEEGGSSYKDLTAMIEELRMHKLQIEIQTKLDLSE